MMVSTKRLRSVVHSIAHHGVSGLCHLHPHLGEACQGANLQTYELSLLSTSERSEFENSIKEIYLSTEALREQFLTIVDSENQSLDDLAEASITFRFLRGRWPSGCYVVVKTRVGHKIDVEVDSMGDPVESIPQ